MTYALDLYSYSLYRQKIKLFKSILKTKRYILREHITLYEIIVYCKVKILKVFLSETKYDPSKNDNYAIWLTVYWARLDICDVLMADPRVNPFDKKNNAFGFAVRSSLINFVELFLAKSRIKDNESLNAALEFASPDVKKIINAYLTQM